jgi:hypothetical protein
MASEGLVAITAEVHQALESEFIIPEWEIRVELRNQRPLITSLSIATAR